MSGEQYGDVCQQKDLLALLLEGADVQFRHTLRWCGLEQFKIISVY